MEALPVTKACQQCGETFLRNRRQNSGWWARAKFCSERCMQAARVPQAKFCPSCGVEFTPTHGPARGQTYCSIGCANRARGINPTTTRYARAKAPDGKSKTMQRAMVENQIGPLPPEIIVHHKDEDKLNNLFSNFDLMTNVEHGRLHNPPTKPVTSDCTICGETFTPHKTKRGRKQTCSPECKSALLKTRWQEHHPRPC